MVDVHDGIPELELALDFYYATLGYHFTEELFAYGSYWYMIAHTAMFIPGDGLKEDEDLFVPTVGMSYDLNDRIRLKGQFARVIDQYKLQLVSQDVVEKNQDKFNVWAIAVSVFF
jgi:hypothetical protein